MKKVLLFCFSIPLILCGQSWQQLADFPAAGRDDGSTFTIGNSVYCGLGNAFGVGPSTDFRRFDATTDTWSSQTVASLPALGRQYSCSFSYQNYGFIATGVDANWNATNQVWRYDTITNSWQQRTPMPDSVQGAACFFINNKAYICSGRNQANQCVSKVWEYDPQSDNWTQKNNMPDKGRWRASAAVINNKGYLLFGADSIGNFSKKLYEYDAGSDNWTLIDSFPGIGRTYAAAAEVNGLLFVGLGIDTANTVYNDCYLYDVNAKQWINQNALPSAGRKGSMIFSHGGSVYITTGIDAANNRLAETWKAGNLNGMAKVADEAEVKIYPNPASDELHVEVRGERGEVRNEKCEIEIRNMLGEKVMSLQAEEKTTIDVGGLPDGVYFINVKGDRIGFIRKFVVKR